MHLARYCGRGRFVSSNDRAQLSTLKVLAMAGGLTPIAKKGQAVIIRKDAPGNQQSIPVDLSKIIAAEIGRRAPDAE